MKFNCNNIFILVLTTIFFSCTSNSNRKNNQQKIEIWDKAKYEKQIHQIEFLKESMTEYMKSAQPSYTEKDIEQCENILMEYIQNIDKTNNKEDGFQVVKTAVIKLNELNEKCNFQLIETGEREQIAEIIITAGNLKGYNSLDEDITERWREW